MASNKKRKLNSLSEPKTLSAFAARRQIQKPNDSGSPRGPSSTDSERQIDSENPLPFDGSITGTSNSTAVTLRSRTGNRSNDDSGKELIKEVIISDSPGQEKDSVEILIESKSREGRSAQVPSRPLVNMTNIKPSKANITYLNSNDLLVKLSSGEKLVIIGEYGLSVTIGQITILGAILSASDTIYPVYALGSHSLPVIRFLASEAGHAEIHIRQQKSGLLSLSQLSPLFGRLSHDRSNSRRFDNTESDFVPLKDSSFQLVRRLSSAADALMLTYTKVFSTEDIPRSIAVGAIITPPEWNEAISITASGKLLHGKSSATMICGPKSSGKSTFARLLANRLLSYENRITDFESAGVAYLDLDPGQPEYSPPGHVSLVYLSQLNLGPPYCHPLSLKGAHDVIRAHSIAALSPAADPNLFLGCVHELLDHYHNILSRDRRCPLIINTPGWVLGTGLEILVDLITAARPTEIFYMSQGGPLNVVNTLRSAANIIPVLTMPSQVTDYPAWTAANLRSMQSMSYFHTTSGEMNVLCWDGSAVSSISPWEVKYFGRKPGILGIMCLSEQPPPEMLKDTIDGTLLSIVLLDHVTAINLVNHQEQEGEPAPLLIFTPEGIPYLNPKRVISLDPKQSQAIGMALLRGIDTKRQILQLLTPISAEILHKIHDTEKMIVLLSGKLDTPGWAYTEDLYTKAVRAKKQRKERRFKSDQDGGEESEDVEDFDTEVVFPLQISGKDCEEEPWIEKLHGDHGRGVGARVWRVRRDLRKAVDGGG